ncbi:MAG: SIS domain-containing protein [Lachnospiraceae bacterium]|nr:SIS domain-containing protein [Lachnospiraceae bacterium]GFI03885.1 fructosamine deglycase FrlB [Lachnospiraceae bacterium]
MNFIEIGTDIKKKFPEISSVLFVGCGASMAELYPGKYLIEHNAQKLRTGLYTAEEFSLSTPSCVGPGCVVITCSLSGGTPETVKASAHAMNLGATVVSVTKEADSALAKNSHYQIIHGFEKNYAAKLEKMTNVLGLACELLNQYEGYEYYDELISGTENIYDLIESAVTFCLPQAKKFAESHKDMEHISIMSSGASEKVAYGFAMFLLMEMQWIKASYFSDGEFFHGPFELAEKSVPYILLMNDGPTRSMDSRALTFLNRFDADVTVLDSKDFGLASKISPHVMEYFNPMLHSGILRVYAEQLAIARNHPLTQRRYMWKLEY